MIWGVVEAVHIPAPERDFELDVSNRLHVMELKPAFVKATAGRSDDELFDISTRMLATPDTAIDDYVDAGHAAERVRDGFGDYFQRYGARVAPILPTPADRHGATAMKVRVCPVECHLQDLGQQVQHQIERSSSRRQIVGSLPSRCTRN